MGKVADMEELREYLNNLTVDEQESFAQRCNTTIGYLRKALSKGQKIGESIVISIERESDRAVTCEHLRPDVDWAYLRGTARASSAAARSAA
jgi:DNA-binding transcriptional regulator YdaS (Cro superfamily)